MIISPLTVPILAIEMKPTTPALLASKVEFWFVGKDMEEWLCKYIQFFFSGWNSVSLQGSFSLYTPQ